MQGEGKRPPPLLRGGGLEKLGRAIRELDEYLVDSTNLEKDRNLVGSGRSVGTIVLGCIVVLCVIGIAAVFFVPDGELAVVLGFISSFIGLIFLLIWLASWIGDRSARHIQDARKPEKAFRRFFSAAKNFRVEVFQFLVGTADFPGHYF